ncbi:RagB/SusD family nutrient uptake outer membrane protein [Olivibacter sp. SDN3]|uniref:RagB/SusD family nutrient uptake outer membrane protein n=1 Tax=Olivibacter sp. SDN3 TaxID=2764720 RepID=UPI0016512970|nr:RagB/SusD family nutrient uptake outer membrane protein [Olivibacter sp. SDN3]QNL48174.1 RagB/SusD family nutrient uptake outer membrane protein [Olivibacter sp. SDN3]
MMIKRKIYGFITVGLLLSSCSKLDLNPLSQGSSETWNATVEEINMSLNGLYKHVFWPADDNSWTDDFIYRESVNAIIGATINGQTDFVNDWWLNAYKCIARANNVLESVGRASGELTEDQINTFIAEARFIRACQYAKLLTHYGNIIYTEKTLEIEEAQQMEQADPQLVLTKIYEDFDFAAGYLKTSYGANELKRATVGAALAMKARIALQMQDWRTASDASEACINLGEYALHTDFSELFLSRTKNSPETIFGLPRSVAMQVTLGGLQDYIPRIAGGYGAMVPTWDLFNAFLCSDGLPIDQSSLYNPQEPFQNRDPRCAATIVEFSTPHIGFIYQPHPDTLQVRRTSDSQGVENRDNRAIAPFASYTGLLWKKGVDEDWLQNSWQAEPDQIIIRYADVLLMYAEAKTELGEIDQSVLDAINQVRARAYGVTAAEMDSYPAITVTAQTALRQLIRTERRMEFAFEGIRYMDLIRWRLAEKILNTPIYGLLDPEELREKVVKNGLWFFPQVTPIDENGIADFSSMAASGLIKQIVIRKFDASRQYLWPIPTSEVLTSGLKQNPNY